jgi:NAD(P)-dependent dehydrogenase (short-subunit alcohol dehydrogenase family)
MGQKLSGKVAIVTGGASGLGRATVDVANAVLFLASDRSAQITGIVLPVDGGVTAGSPLKQFKEIMAARGSATAQ